MSTTSFIPYQDHHIIEGYSMVSSFVESGNDGLKEIGGKYKNYLEGLIPGKGSPNEQALTTAINTLKIIVERERAEEIAFLNELNKLLGISLDDTKNTWGLLIKSFNQIFSVEAVFKKNIAKLKKMYGVGAGKYQDITRFLRKTYVPNAIAEYLPTIKSIGDITDELLLKIMKRAVELMFLSEKSNKKNDTEQPYLEMFEAISRLGHDNEVFKNLVSLFKLDEYLTKNLDTLRSGKTPSISAKQANPEGEVYEQIEGAILEEFSKGWKFSNKSDIFELNGEVIRTGATGQKADIAIIMAEGEIDTSPLTSGSTRVDNSVRLRSLERMEELFQNIGEQKSKVIFISDKNYEIGENTYFGKHGGFTAQDVKLRHLIQYGAEFHIPNVKDMIQYLASAGDRMIVNEVDAVLEVIEVYIGNFLFDDLQINVPSPNTNRVHLLSLAGVYIPASVYLQAALMGFQNVLEGFNRKDFVQTSYEPKFKEPQGSSKESWDQYMEYMKDQSIHISFMAGYVKFIGEVFSGSEY